MEWTLKTLGFLLAVALCLQLFHAQVGESVYVPVRCLCPKTNALVPEGFITTFSITEKGPHCKYDEIILTLKNKAEVCLSSEERQGKNLLSCWKRINKDESKKMLCLRRKKPHKK
ncbi:hypothetical protein AGOR_G00199730 [Albula goreensis]|uniref:Chemokine interleukin-8-like domain-containing protein n=1 Tax=Albula goreensis TaxID=1534307 RepID=A0A8T3CNT5_9TELE|nr:hypothetical protein AGOR_G00199730 [Albula goreensis]